VVEIQQLIDPHSAHYINLLDMPSRRLVREAQITAYVGPQEMSGNGGGGGGKLPHWGASNGRKEKVYQCWLFNDKIVLARPASKMRVPSFHIKHVLDFEQLASTTLHHNDDCFDNEGGHGDQYVILNVAATKEVWFLAPKAKEHQEWEKDLKAVVEDCRERRDKHRGSVMSLTMSSSTGSSGSSNSLAADSPSKDKMISGVWSATAIRSLNDESGGGSSRTPEVERQSTSLSWGDDDDEDEGEEAKARSKQVGGLTSSIKSHFQSL